MSLVTWILIVSFAILVHELGHGLAAKMLGIGVERISLGFGKPILKFKYGETEYCIAPILLGGYSRIPVLRIARSSSSVVPIPAWKKVVILASGSTANLLVGILFFFCVFIIIAYSGSNGFLSSAETYIASIESQNPLDFQSMNDWLTIVFQLTLIAGAINIVSFAFNLLPLPLLDGGNLLFASIEGIRGKPFSDKAKMTYILSGIALLAGLTLWALLTGLRKLFV